MGQEDAVATQEMQRPCRACSTVKRPEFCVSFSLVGDIEAEEKPRLGSKLKEMFYKRTEIVLERDVNGK